MRLGTLAGFVGVAVLGGTAGGLGADAQSNPYQDIVTRNAFALKPPPPPPPPGSEQPPASAVDVFLTGITTVGGVKKVLLQIVDKGPNKKPEPLPPPLEEKDVQGRVEVVSIDPDKGAVVIKLDGNEKTLTFEKDAPKPAAAAVPGAGLIPGRPGLIAPPNPAGTIPLPGVNTAAGAAAAVGRAGGKSYGVTVGGGGASVPAPGASVGGASAVANPLTTGGAAATGGLPSRPVRTMPDSSGGVYVGGAPTGGASPVAQGTDPASAPTMTREQIYAHIEEQRALIKQATDLNLIPKGSMPPLPPTPLTPRTPVQPPGGVPVPPN